ncbi:MAG TPA: redox-sensing transcriptional repressor Rex [Bryobacteraceae bacterium]|nr:redox-sensing transcriptional repressor Rex [Bryobacteraceae bacterium]
MEVNVDPDKPRVIAEPTLRRLPRYHHYLTELAEKGIKSISCSQIGAELSLDPTQIRKDLECTEVGGKPKVGYVIADLMRAIEDLLGWNNARDAFLAGAGHLGSALLGYNEGFRRIGLNIVAAFDIDPGKVGKQVHGTHVLPLSKLANLSERMHIHLGIITTPASVAQSVAHLMVEGGIRAIWNFAPVSLHVPSHVIVQNESLYASLSALSFKLNRQLQSEIHKEEKENDSITNSSSDDAG